MLWLLVCIFLVLTVREANAFSICWTAPTENTDGTPVAGLSHFTVYYGNDRPGQWDRTQRIPQTGDGCANIRASRGIWYAAMSATDIVGDESSLSNWVTKEENRLGGPSGGRLVGPSNGTVF